MGTVPPSFFLVDIDGTMTCLFQPDSCNFTARMWTSIFPSYRGVVPSPRSVAYSGLPVPYSF
ncbi:hypothetical protein B0H13DRAFT_2321589 [Mycena leptocephala]|nr:hypothetical protein B0H13DRAFT_2321589 [Mycena leptocephala]